MLAEILKKSFNRYFDAPIEAWIAFAELCEPVTFEKDQIIKEQGKIEKYFYFIKKGSAGVFLWCGNNFVCLDFAFDNHFCCDYMSILSRQSTPLELVALEKSEMVRITAEEFYKLGQTPIGKVIQQISAETSFVEKQQQQIELLTRSAKERYIILLEKFPDIENRIAQKHVASYLGITPQSLSRLRNTVI